MATKLSELMLDMETGDACMEDAYIASAKGKIAVSHAIFEAAYKNYELPDDGQFVCYVESDQEGIPTESEKAAGTACAAVGQELGAFLDATIETAKKVKSSAEKDLKTLIAVGKKVGVGMSGDFEKEFATPLGQEICSEGRLTLTADKFMKSKNSCKIAKAYTKGCVYTLAAFGINVDIPETVKSFVSVDSSAGTVDSLKKVESKLSDGGRAFAIGEIGTTNTASASDIADLALAVYTCANVADAVIKACGSGAKKDAISNINSFCSEGNGKISRSHHAINGDIKKYMSNLEKIGSTIASGFTDAVYALMETISKK